MCSLAEKMFNRAFSSVLITRELQSLENARFLRLGRCFWAFGHLVFKMNYRVLKKFFKKV